MDNAEAGLLNERGSEAVEECSTAKYAKDCKQTGVWQGWFTHGQFQYSAWAETLIGGVQTGGVG